MRKILLTIVLVAGCNSDPSIDAGVPDLSMSTDAQALDDGSDAKSIDGGLVDGLDGSPKG